jgi:hypothetical protein
MPLKLLAVRVGIGLSLRSIRRKPNGWFVKNLMSTPIHFQVICNFHVPTKEQTDLYLDTYDLDFRGTSGPIQVTNPTHYHAADAF